MRRLRKGRVPSGPLCGRHIASAKKPVPEIHGGGGGLGGFRLAGFSPRRAAPRRASPRPRPDLVGS